MKILVIPDIHHKFVRAQAIVDSVEHDRVVFTGDYFDSIGGTVEDARNTAIWLKEKVLYNPKAVVLIGNHDASYLWPNNINFWCSGFTAENSVAINGVLNQEDKNRFKVFHIEENFAFSHAGLSNRLWQEMLGKYPSNPGKSTLDFFSEVLEAFVASALIDANHGRNAILFGAGYDRRGTQPIGGITWQDWRYFAPINGVNQIVGHTTSRLPRILIQKEGGAVSQKTILDHYQHERMVEETNAHRGTTKPKRILSTNYNFDTGLNHYAVIEDGRVDIYDQLLRVNLRDVSKYAIPTSELNNLT